MAKTKVTTDVIDMSGNTGGLVWAKGDTAAQPAGTAGDLRENTETKRTELFNGTAWVNLKESNVVGPNFTANFLIVAGGAGGGGFNNGGGGGAGGYRTSYGTVSPITLTGGSMETSLNLSLGTNYNITVGSPGAGGNGASSPGLNGSDGQNSLFGLSGSEIISTGGGGGGADSNVANTGGSGGGGGYNSGTGASSVTSPVVQGFAGGRNGAAPGAPYDAGGGGGAGEVGDTDANGYGGDGLENQITGATGIFYAGGGGGGTNGSAARPGGDGGGGAGGRFNSASPDIPVDGGLNLGGGGGGATYTTGSPTLNGAAGGAGIVILRCAIATATLGSGITVNGTAGPGTATGTAISGTSDYYYSATLGTGTITF